jgi:ABC-type Fe3+-hydroxamate transport system substrate-binding protein
MNDPDPCADDAVKAMSNEGLAGGRQFRAIIAAAVYLPLLLIGCSSEPEPTDSLGPQASTRSAARVVSLLPVATEMLLELGARDALVAVDPGSRALGGLEALPVVDLAGSVALAPDFVVVPALSDLDQPIADQLRAHGSEVIEFAPHDFDDVYRFCNELGFRLGRPESARAYVREHSRELAVMSAAAFGFRRPRVAALVALSPLEVAGGHSFITDLIEIAGAESVTHGNDDPRVAMSAAQLLATGPELLLVMTSAPLSEAERRTLRAMLGDGPEITFMVFDREHFWLRRAVEIAMQVREFVAPLVRGRLLDETEADRQRMQVPAAGSP